MIRRTSSRGAQTPNDRLVPRLSLGSLETSKPGPPEERDHRETGSSALPRPTEDEDLYANMPCTD